MKDIVKKAKRNSKEYIILLFALLMQAYLGYNLAVITMAMSTTPNFLYDNLSKIVMTFIGFIISSGIIIFMGYLFVRKRVKHPIKKTIQFVLLYIGIQIIVAFLMGYLSKMINNQTSTYTVMLIIQYIIRYLFLFYVFKNVNNRSLASVKKNIIIGFIITFFFIIIKFLPWEGLLYIMAEAFFNFILIIYFHLTIHQKVGESL